MLARVGGLPPHGQLLKQDFGLLPVEGNHLHGKEVLHQFACPLQVSDVLQGVVPVEDS